MNLLAHGALVWKLGSIDSTLRDPFLLAATITADRCKGPLSNWQTWPLPVQRGIALHRAIDKHTDSHKIIREATSWFGPGARRFAPIVLDLFGDLHLSRNWSTIMIGQPKLDEFLEMAHNLLQTNAAALPPPAGQWAQTIAKHGFLGNCTDWQGLRDTTVRMSHRLTRSQGLLLAVQQMELLDSQLEQSFTQFFAQPMEFLATH